MNRFALNAIARASAQTITLTVPKIRIRNMFNNQYLFQHIERQPNVIFVVYESDAGKPPVQCFNKLATMDVYVVQGVTFLELKIYATSYAAEPVKVLTITNPRSWEQVAQPDPPNLE